MLVELALDVLTTRLGSRDDGRWTTDDTHAAVSRPGFRAASSVVSLLDIGTGSGAIPIAVASKLPHANIMASDVSADALAVARINAERNNVAGQISFVQSDLLANIAELPHVLTANLPYVTTEEITGLQPEIQDHEPRVALDGGKDGLGLVRKLLIQIAQRIETQPMQAVFLEFGASQGAAVLNLAQTILPFAQSEIKQDLAKLDRVLCLYFQSPISNP